LGWWRTRRRDREILKVQADLDVVQMALQRRTDILAATARALEETGAYPSHLARPIAVADLFVEKAQQVLTERSRRMHRQAVLATVAVIALMTAAAIFVGYIIFQGLHAQAADLDTNVLILRLAQSLSLGAFGFVAVKYLTSLARAFFHESTKLLDRRHAMRFGRLYVHLNAERLAHDPGRTDSPFDVETLAQAFDWNIDSPSAFLDVDPKLIADTIWNKMVEQVGKLPAETIAAVAAQQASK
jgi:hypothetical protein